MWEITPVEIERCASLMFTVSRCGRMASSMANPGWHHATIAWLAAGESTGSGRRSQR